MTPIADLDPLLWASLATVTAVWAVTVMSPGPNFLATAHAALASDRSRGLWLSAGIALGTTIWATASLLGLGLLFQTLGWLYVLVKIAGATYLIIFGLRLLLSRAAPPSTQGQAAGPVLTGGQAFRRGLLTDLSNPKAAAFFTSLFAVAVPPQAPLWFDAVIIALVVVLAGGWYALVACVVSHPKVAMRYAKAQAVLNRITGAVLLAFGVKLMVSGDSTQPAGR